MSTTVLVVDDDPGMCKMLESGLARVGHDTASTTSADTALELLHQRDFDAVITDLRMRRVDGLELCRRIVATHPDVPVIVITAFGSMDVAIEAIRAGAYDFVTKPFDLATIRLSVRRAVHHRRLSHDVRRLEQALRDSRGMEDLVGSSEAMGRLYDLVDRIAPTDAAVLITGESGTGKELVARALHRRSSRADGPFVAVNCAAMPEALLESELFGHVRGSFTDARGNRAGIFVQAHRGTLLLDEIGELPLSLQPKLLRALEERAVRPVGSNDELPFDARVLVATNRDLDTAVEEGTFREDLYYRIQVIEVEVPPLRARGNDVLLLAQHFVDHFAASSGKNVRGILPAAAQKLLSYPWPGNVRELRNCIERAVTLCRYNELTPDDLPDRLNDVRRIKRLLGTDELSELLPLHEIERRYILEVFDATDGNKSLAAKILGLNRKTLYRKLHRYGVGGIGSAPEGGG